MTVEMLGSIESMSLLVDSLVETGLLKHDNSKSGTNAIMIFFIFCLLFYLDEAIFFIMNGFGLIKL